MIECISFLLVGLAANCIYASGWFVRMENNTCTPTTSYYLMFKNTLRTFEGGILKYLRTFSLSSKIRRSCITENIVNQDSCEIFSLAKENRIRFTIKGISTSIF